jgi:Cohesin domain/PEP-CTERM motif
MPGPARAVVLIAGSDTVSIGDVFTIPISVSSASGLTSYQSDLSFNPSIIEVLSFDDGTTAFASEASAEGGFLTGITGFIDNTTGLLSGVADSMSGNSGPGLTPGGTIADITFEALSVGTTPLTLANVFVTDGGTPLSLGVDEVQDGSVTVTAPEPGTLPLFGAALLALAAARLSRSKARAKIDR